MPLASRTVTSVLLAVTRVPVATSHGPRSGVVSAAQISRSRTRPMIAALAGMAQMSNRVLLPRFGPKAIVPTGLVMNAAALYLLHRVGLHSSYASHVLPYLVLLGSGSA